MKKGKIERRKELETLTSCITEWKKQYQQPLPCGLADKGGNHLFIYPISTPVPYLKLNTFLLFPCLQRMSSRVIEVGRKFLRVK